MINTQALQDLVNALSPACKLCSVKDGLPVNKSTVHGLSSKLEVECTNCDNIMYTGNTSPILQDGKPRDINNRYVSASKSSGIGYEQLCSFLANLNAQPPIVHSLLNDKLAKLSDIREQALRDHLTTVQDIVRLKYIEDIQARPEDDDSTWHNCGHTSHTGIGVAIDILTGQVVDVEVVSNFCQVCECEKNMEDDRTLSSLKDFTTNISRYVRSTTVDQVMPWRSLFQESLGKIYKWPFTLCNNAVV